MLNYTFKCKYRVSAYLNINTNVKKKTLQNGSNIELYLTKKGFYR